MTVSPGTIREAVRIVRAGGLIAFPTETYYGLGVDPFNREALARLFAVKGRQRRKPVLVLVGGQDGIGSLARAVPEPYARIMDRFWPGPVTLVFQARPGIPDLLTGDTGTVGIRQSPHPCAVRLLDRLGGPLTATSANRSGAPAARTAAEVRRIFGSEVDLVLDDDATPGHLPSTLVGLGEGGLVCLREGAVPFAEILAVLAKRGSGE